MEFSIGSEMRSSSLFVRVEDGHGAVGFRFELLLIAADLKEVGWMNLGCLDALHQT